MVAYLPFTIAGGLKESMTKKQILELCASIKKYNLFKESNSDIETVVLGSGEDNFDENLKARIDELWAVYCGTNG